MYYLGNNNKKKGLYMFSMGATLVDLTTKYMSTTV